MLRILSQARSESSTPPGKNRQASGHGKWDHSVACQADEEGRNGDVQTLLVAGEGREQSSCVFVYQQRTSKGSEASGASHVKSLGMEII